MFSKIHKRMKGEKGFTLIELLVVIIIIAILAAIAIPTFLGQRQKAQDAAAKSLVRNAMTAIESAYVDTRTFDAAAADPITDTMLQGIEPSIVFTSVSGAGSLAQADPVDASVDAQLNAVGWDGMSATSYGAGCQSQSGKTFSVVVNKSATTDADGNVPGNTFYVNGAPHSW
jgi:type IV pilus assembly protein PilA